MAFLDKKSLVTVDGCSFKSLKIAVIFDKAVIDVASRSNVYTLGGQQNVELDEDVWGGFLRSLGNNHDES